MTDEVKVEQIDATTGVEHWQQPDARELGLLYNHKPDDSAQFTRWQMMAAIAHGRRLAARPAPAEDAVERVAEALATRYIERCQARYPERTYKNWAEMPGSYRNDFITDARAALAAMQPRGEQQAGREGRV